LRAEPEKDPAPGRDESLEEVEAHLIRKTLARCDGNAQKSGGSLGLKSQRVLSGASKKHKLLTPASCGYPVQVMKRAFWR
jgi:transcriptional regulator with PAS, ATPase and Fis domain